MSGWLREELPEAGSLGLSLPWLILWDVPTVPILLSVDEILLYKFAIFPDMI